MNILRKITGYTADPLEARLDRLVGRRELTPIWQMRVAKPVYHPGVELYRDARGVIRHVRIGAWRVIATSQSRTIAEVRDLACSRVAVRIERADATSRISRGTIWELYDLEGHLLAMLQNVPDQNVWLGTDYETGRLARETILNPESYFPSLSERCRWITWARTSSMLGLSRRARRKESRADTGSFMSRKACPITEAARK